MKLCIIFTVIIFVFTSLANAQIPQSRNTGMGKYEMVNGINMYYEISGEGQPLLLLHGNGGSVRSLAADIAFFEKKYKVIAVDSRCHGRSGCNVLDMSYEMLAADINELLNKLDVDSCLIWGHSDGGITGLILAYQFPSKVKKLITTGVNSQKDSTAIFPELIHLAKMYPLLTDTLMQKQIKLTVFHPNIPFQKLTEIKAPVLLIAGDRDAIRPEHTLRIFQAIPQSQLCILPGTTHFVSVEKSQLFHSLAADFFQNSFTMPSTVQIIQRYAEQKLREQ